jgi:MFS family permease
LFIIHETLTQGGSATPAVGEAAASGYRYMLRDRTFMSIWGFYILAQIASSMVFVLLGEYVKTNYGIKEDRFGMIIGTNAATVVLFQYVITRRATQYSPLPIMAVGTLLYVLGLGGFALSQGFTGFLLGMVIFTCGEMLLIPTATALVANIAPPAMRARYIGVFSLSFRVASGIGPVMGGLLSDQIAPVATWYGGMAVCTVAAVGFVLLHLQRIDLKQIYSSSKE